MHFISAWLAMKDIYPNAQLKEAADLMVLFYFIFRECVLEIFIDTYLENKLFGDSIFNNHHSFDVYFVSETKFS